MVGKSSKGWLDRLWFIAISIVIMVIMGLVYLHRRNNQEQGFCGGGFG